MDYVKIFGTDLRVSRLALGGWQIGGRSFGPMSTEIVRDILWRCLDLGITFFDAAPCYGRGRCEELLGELLPRRSDIVVATKVGLRWGADMEVYEDLSRASILFEVEESLRRLNRESIDLYQVHWPDPSTPLEESFSTLAELRQQGKIRHVGVCNYTTAELATIREIVPIVTLQNRLNLLQRENEADVKWCREKRVGFLAHSSLATGLLSGKYSKNVTFDDARNRYAMYKGDELERNLNLVDAYRRDAESRGVPLLKFALDYLLEQAGVAAAIVGTRSAAQLSDLVETVYPRVAS